MRSRAVVLAGLLALPLAGLALLLAVPELDIVWEHHPSHFWLVLGVALANVVLGTLTSEAASHRSDPLFLVSLALLSSAGFLGLHALATPGVVLAEKMREAEQRCDNGLAVMRVPRPPRLLCRLLTNG